MTQHRAVPSAKDYHRRPLRLLNFLLQRLQPLQIGRADLSEQSLMDDARRVTGLDDFGDDPFLEPMRILLHSLEEEAELNPLGRYLTRLSLLRLLKHRLWAEDLFKRHPDILQREIKAPVVIVGLARSGTTRLHRLLAADQRFLHLKSWETVNPVPWPSSFTADRDPRITNIEGALKAVLYMSPQIAAVHPLGAHEVEEEVGLLQHAFSSQIFEVQAKLPTFANWLMTHDQTYAYEYMVKLMKLVSWFRGDDPAKPWVMKTPQHMQDLDALIKVFPDARLVFSHRDPIRAVGSACSMTWNAIVRDTNNIDPLWVGQEWFSKTVSMVNKTLAIRDQLIPEKSQLDVQYADINQDWEQQIRRIYQYIDLPFTAAAKASMEQWRAGNAQHKHGEHKYSLEDFGLDPKKVDNALIDYRQRFNIPYE